MNNLIKQAFTLIELLVVIAIIGILSGLIIVTMNGVTSKANIAKSQIFSNSLKNALMMNLVSEWKLDENAGSTTVDNWSGGNTGTLSGSTHSVTWKTGSDCVNGSCLQFDGIDDYVGFGTNSSLSMGTGDTTVSFWVKFDNATAPQYETLILTGGANNGDKGYWINRMINTSVLYFYFSDGSPSIIGGSLSATGSLINNNWYNIVVVFDRDSVAQAYINGTKTNYPRAISSQQGNIINTLPLRIGGYNSAYHRLAGKMDEVRLYNAAMPTSQIKEQYYSGLNSLFINGGITKEEYLSRINNYASNN